MWGGLQSWRVSLVAPWHLLMVRSCFCLCSGSLPHSSSGNAPYYEGSAYQNQVSKELQWEKTPQNQKMYVLTRVGLLWWQLKDAHI